MNIYLVSRTDKIGYDQYSAMVVVAPDEETALNTSPYNGMTLPAEDDDEGWRYSSWARPSTLNIRLIAREALYEKPEIILASFHAG